jgi:hypothetical protein
MHRELYEFGDYKFELKYHSAHVDKLVALQPLPDNVSFRSDGELLARSGDTFFITRLDDKIQFYIDNKPIYRLYKHVTYSVMEVPTPFN